jgi:hypothetical protein
LQRVTTQPSRALLIAAGVLTQVLGVICLVLSFASLPVAHDLKTGTSGVIASIFASLAAVVCGTFIWRGRLIPLALAMGLNVGFGIGLPRAGSAIGSTLRFAGVDGADTVIAIAMFIAATLCIVAVPSALKLRAWARGELAKPDYVEPPRPSIRTLPGVGPQKKLVPTQVIHVGGGGGKPAVIIGTAVTLIAIGIIVITATLGGSSPDDDVAKPDTHVVVGGSQVVGSAVEPGIAVEPGVAVDSSVAPPSLDDFIASFHASLSDDKLEPLFDPRAFAFGVEANDIAEGRDAAVKQLREDIGIAPRDVTAKFSSAGSDGDVGWLAEELRVGDNTFVITAALGLADNAWTIRALHWGKAMPNTEAYKLVKEGNLATPDVIPDTHDDSELAKAMRDAFASKAAFVDARSARPEAFNFGSAPGERVAGGEAIKKIFDRIKATIHLHDAVKVGMIGTRGGWGAANVDFTDSETQTFRVLAVWLHEDQGWRIVQTQWSNPR